MTTSRVLRAAGRLWWVVALGSILTLAAARFVWTAPGVYWAQADVVFLTPSSPPNNPNPLGFVSSNVIRFASVIQREVAGGPESASVVSPNVTIKDQGTAPRTTVTLPSSGGQWTVSFDRAVLRVQVIDRTEEQTAQRLGTAVAQIQQLVDKRQREAGVGPNAWISTGLSPSDPPIRYDEGERRRAVLALGMLGLGLTGSVVVLLESRRLRAARLFPDDGMDRSFSGKPVTESVAVL